MARGIHICSYRPCEGITFFEPPPKRWNWLGISGLLTSIAGIFTFGLASPLGLLLSLVAMRRGPRKAAAVGTVIGGLGTAFIVSMGLLLSNGISQARLADAMDQTNNTMQTAVVQVEQYHRDHKKFPSGIDGNKLFISAELTDAWGELLRYDRIDNEQFSVRSAGPDREFDTEDDLTRS